MDDILDFILELPDRDCGKVIQLERAAAARSSASLPNSMLEGEIRRPP
jgi:hypothetical protein